MLSSANYCNLQLQKVTSCINAVQTTLLPQNHRKKQKYVQCPALVIAYRGYRDNSPSRTRSCHPYNNNTQRQKMLQNQCPNTTSENCTTVLGQYGVSKPTFALVLGLLKQVWRTKQCQPLWFHFLRSFTRGFVVLCLAFECQ